MSYQTYYPRYVDVEVGQHKFKMDSCLKSQYDIIQNRAIPNRWDAPIINVGMEGVGKSTNSSQGAVYVQPEGKLTMANMVFTPEQFLEALTLPEGSSIIWDEAITGAMSQQAKAISLTIIQKFTQIRKKRYKIFINFPYLWLLNKYFVTRALAVVRNRTTSFTREKTYFEFYTRKQAKIIIGLMKERYRVNPDRAFNSVPHAFYGYFTDYFPLDQDKYDAKKEAAISTLDSKSGDKWKAYFFKTLQAIKGSKGVVSITTLANELKVSPQYLYQELKKYSIGNEG